MTYAEAASFPIPFSTAVQNLYFRHDLPYPSVVGPNSFSIENVGRLFFETIYLLTQL